jgi:hypothetical protein
MIMTPEKLDELYALANAGLGHPHNEAILDLIRDNKSRRNMLDMVINSVAAALERAGVTEVDDPGEAIDVLVADKDAEIARLMRRGQELEGAMQECIVFLEKMEESHRHPIMAAINARAALNKETK